MKWCETDTPKFHKCKLNVRKSTIQIPANPNKHHSSVEYHIISINQQISGATYCSLWLKVLYVRQEYSTLSRGSVIRRCTTAGSTTVGAPLSVAPL